MLAKEINRLSLNKRQFQADFGADGSGANEVPPMMIARLCLLPLNHANRPHAGHFFGQSRSMDDFDHQVDILVRIGLFFGEAFPTAGLRDDALGENSRSMRRPWTAFTAAVRLITRPAPWQAVPNVRSMLPGWPARIQLARPMSPGMMHRLADFCDRPSGISGCPGGKARVAPLRCTHTRFANAVDSRAARAWRCCGPRRRSNPCPDLPTSGRTCCENTSRACHIRSCRLHQAKFAAARMAPRYCLPSVLCDRGADQLAVGQIDAVFLRRAAQIVQGIVAHLVTQAARAGMDHHANLSFGQAHRRGGRIVENCDRPPALRENDCPSRACRIDRRRDPARDRSRRRARRRRGSRALR